MKSIIFLTVFLFWFISTNTFAEEKMLCSAMIQIPPVAKTEVKNQSSEELTIPTECITKPEKNVWDDISFQTIVSSDSRWATDEFFWFPFENRLVSILVESEYSLSPSLSFGKEESFGVLVVLSVDFD